MGDVQDAFRESSDAFGTRPPNHASEGERLNKSSSPSDPLRSVIEEEVEWLRDRAQHALWDEEANVREANEAIGRNCAFREAADHLQAALLDNQGPDQQRRAEEIVGGKAGRACPSCRASAPEMTWFARPLRDGAYPSCWVIEKAINYDWVQAGDFYRCPDEFHDTAPEPDPECT